MCKLPSSRSSFLPSFFSYYMVISHAVNPPGSAMMQQETNNAFICWRVSAEAQVAALCDTIKCKRESITSG